MIAPQLRQPAAPRHPHPRPVRPVDARRAARRLAALPVALATAVALASCTTGTPPAAGSTATPTSTATAPSPAAPTAATPTVTPSPAPSATDAPAPPAPTAQPPAPGTTDVEVVVTFSGWNSATSAAEVGAYVATLDAGTCTLRLTGPGGATAETTTATVADATTVSCDGLAIESSLLSSGSWSGVVEYVSSRASGRATVPPIEVP